MTSLQPRLKVALVYDFDGTLARGNIQEHSFIPALGIDAAAFWREVKDAARQHDADEILIYMQQMLAHARAQGIRITAADLQGHGRPTPLFDGVITWFDRVNTYAAELGLDLEHYIISSGILEMIQGTPIADRFRMIFASKFVYAANGEAIAPGVAVNYTNKTQFLFRINKGILNYWDNEGINQWIPMAQRPVPFSRMVFVGDGETDIPAMKMVRHQGGYAVAVFDPSRWSSLQHRIHRLIAEDRADYVASADYQAGSQLDVTIRGVLGRIVAK
jgi:phosphoserine phosphatase